MAERRRFRLVHAKARELAEAAVREAPDGYHVEVKPPTRSLAQNARLWAMLTDVSDQVEWYGQKLSPDSWKCIFSASLKKQDAVPGIDGGFVVVGAYTSKMTVAEMGDLTILIEAFGAERSVVFGDEARAIPTRFTTIVTSP